MICSYKRRMAMYLNCQAIYFYPGIIMIGSSNLAFGQVGAVKPEVQKLKGESEERIFMVVEQQPEFPGGLEARKKFFS